VYGGSGVVDLGALKGRPVVLNFWGSWCVPCRTELPILAASARAEGKRVHFVGVDLEDTRAGAQAFLRRYHVPYPSGFDPGDSVASRYAVGGTPTTVFIDSRGHRVGTVPGALTASRLAWWLDHLH
jgi:cytochrome c biogenesis protein CcmG/thiol:disulfide interchange protein DsbE